MRGIAIVALAVTGACNFNPGAAPGDAGPDGPPPITVGFAQASSLTDESAGTVSVRVVLSAPSDAPITVDYAFVDGSPSTATRPADYLGTDGTLTFAPGDVEELIELTVREDADEEADEDLRINLTSPTGGAGLGTAAHTVTISANTLPRINFSVGTSMNDEGVSPTLEVTLDKASQLMISATIAVTGGTATANGTDFNLSATTVTFQPGDTSETINLTVMNDTLDEDDETAIVEIQNPMNVVAGTTVSRMHTIQDNDDPPDVGFTLVSSSVAEGVAGIDVEVSLTTASGKAISVPFSVDNASSAAGTDYAIPTASPLTFAPGETTKIIRVNVTDDTAVEAAESVVLSLGAATNAGAGTNQMHTLTLNDNDSVCLGAGGYAACVAIPSAAQALPLAIDTDASALCSSPVSGWTGQPDACFIVATDITVNITGVVGSRPLVLFATNNITINTLLDVSSHFDVTTGPGAGIGCGAYSDFPANDTGSGNGGGGGAGGSFRSAGGNGGEGDGANNSGGTALAAVGAPTTLRGGCAGQDGGDGSPSNGTSGGIGGKGGGAVYLVAGGTITIASTAAINASGAAGVARTSPDSGFNAGGGGGGSGGMIKLHAAAFSVASARLLANGGGGSAGGDDNAPGVTGNEPNPVTPTSVATGGDAGPTSAGANGGNGFAGTTQATAGGNGSGANGGGGGGGGGGHIEANLPLTGATVSAGP